MKDMLAGMMSEVEVVEDEAAGRDDDERQELFTCMNAAWLGPKFSNDP